MKLNIPIEARQDTDQWVAARRGKLTASRMDEAMSFLKNGSPSAKRVDLMMELVAERMTGIAATHYVTPAMQWGIDQEANARRAFEEKTGLLVHPAGLVNHPSIEHFAGTPDGFIVPAHLNTIIPVEIKCPTTKTFVEWRLSGQIPEEYRRQMLAQMACCAHFGSPITEAIFIAYDPRITVGRNLIWHPLSVTIADIEEIEAAARVFLGETERMFETVTQSEDSSAV